MVGSSWLHGNGEPASWASSITAMARARWWVLTSSRSAKESASFNAPTLTRGRSLGSIEVWSNSVLLDCLLAYSSTLLAAFVTVMFVIGLVSVNMGDESRANLPKMDLNQRLTDDRLATMLGRWSDGTGPLHRQLTAAVADLIERGILRHGDVLPPERRLAGALAVSRGTVVKVYGQLAEDGLVTRQQGSGTVVSTASVSIPAFGTALGSPLFERNDTSIELLTALPGPLPRALEIAGNPRLERYAEHLARDEPAGIEPLRERIAEHITAEGLPTRPSQVLVCAGAQQGIALVNQLFVSAGEYVLTEEWTWPAAIDGVTSRGGRVHGVALDEGGIVTSALQTAIELFRPSMICLNPHHHNPTGTRSDNARRAEIARLAAAYGIVLLEDRANAHIAYDGQVAPPFGSYGAGGQEIVIDSINKVAWPGFRLGWVRADVQIIAKLRELRVLADLASPVPVQVAAIDVLDVWDELVAERVAVVMERCDVLFDACAEFLPDWSAHRPRGGLVSWWQIPFGAAAEFATFAQRYGVQVASGRQFAAQLGDDLHIRLPFTATEAELVEGIRRLGLAWNDYAAQAA